MTDDSQAKYNSQLLKVKVKQGAVKDLVLTHILTILSRTTCNNYPSYHTVKWVLLLPHMNANRCFSPQILNRNVHKPHLSFTHSKLTQLSFIHTQTQHCTEYNVCKPQAERTKGNRKSWSLSIPTSMLVVILSILQNKV